MNAWWQHFASFMSPTEASVLVNYGMQRPAVQATVGHGAGASVNATMRRSVTHWLDPAAVDLQWLVERIRHRGLQANSNAFGFDLQGFPSLQFTEYHANENGHYDWHEDNCWVPAAEKRTPFTRKMSFVCLLSDCTSFEGGKLELDRAPLNAGMMTKAGEAVFFPSFLRHRVTPVTAGVRYSLVAWFEGPQWR